MKLSSGIKDGKSIRSSSPGVIPPGVIWLSPLGVAFTKDGPPGVTNSGGF